MVFKRRVQPSLLRRMLDFLWPAKGFVRGWRYIRHRLERLNDTPSKIALGFACGAFASFTPFFGLHFIIAALLARMLSANIVGSIFGTIVGNPISFPLIAGTCMATGNFLLGRNNTTTDGEGIIQAFVEIGHVLKEGLLSAIGLAEPGAMTWIYARDSLTDFFTVFMLPYGLGGLVWGIPVTIASFYIIRPAVAAYQKRRAEKLLKKKIERREREKASLNAAE